LLNVPAIAFFNRGLSHRGNIMETELWQSVGFADHEDSDAQNHGAYMLATLI